MPIHVRSRGPPVHDRLRAGQVAKLPDSRSVVGVRVCVEDELQPAVPVGQQRQVAVDLFPYRVDEDGSVALLAGHQVCLATAPIQLTAQHVGSPGDTRGRRYRLIREVESGAERTRKKTNQEKNAWKY